MKDYDAELVSLHGAFFLVSWYGVTNNYVLCTEESETIALI